MLLPVDLRDYFAGRAITGMIANETYRNDMAEIGVGEEKALAHYAYEIADAMLAARWAPEVKK